MSAENLDSMHINYICKYVNNMNLNELQQIYKIMLDAGVPEDKFNEKGAGIEIKFRNIGSRAIRLVYEFIEEKMRQKQSEIESFPEHDIHV